MADNIGIFTASIPAPFAKGLAGVLAGLLLCFGLLAATPAQAGRIEAGTFTAHDTLGTNRTPDRVTFQQAFDTTPIVIVLSNSSGGNAASVQITNVSTTGFDELILEPDNFDGRHLSMLTQYIAVEPGRHVLPDGTVIEAGFTNTSAVQFGSGFTGGTASWANVSFSAPLAGTPTVVHHLQTANSETRDVANASSRPHITSIAQSPSITGFQVALDRSQAFSGPFPTSEQIGWIAFPSGSSGTFPNTAGADISYNAMTTTPFLRGWDQGCQSTAHGLNSGSAVVVAKKLSRNNDDGGWIRNCAVNSATITLRIDEDTDQDNERTIAAGDAEQVAIIAFSDSFHALLEADVDVTKSLIALDDNRGGDFALPGGFADYLITVTNTGNSPPNENSVEVTETLPPETDLVLADFGSAGSGPVEFQQGTPPSALTCTFVSFASTTDCYDFSTDGVNYGYEPVDSGDGTDPAVRFIRAIPTGFMAPDDGSGSPEFELRLRVKIR
jgi:uncharacterized repeat protein (TIGR01451 family)